MDALDFYDNSMEHLAYLATQKRVPIAGTFELLPFCNMKCRMCYIVHDGSRNRKALKSVDFWKRLIEECIDSGMMSCLLTGGEPFLYPELGDLLRWLTQQPIHITLNTNATLLNKELVEMLSKIRLTWINISLYGASNDTYNRLCGNPQGFDQVMNALSLLDEYGVPYRINTTLTPYNYEDYDNMKEICNQHHTWWRPTAYMFPPYRKDEGLIKNEGRFSPKEFAEISLRVLRDSHTDYREYRNLLETTCTAFEHPEIYSLYGKRTIACRGGFSTFWVDWRGQMSGCGIHTVEKINMEETDFHTAWQRVVANTECTFLSEKCSICGYRSICSVCAASAFCETGNIDGTPEYLCEFCRIYADLLKEELEGVRKREYV